MNMSYSVAEFGTSFIVSSVLSEVLSLDNLWTALITFAISLITVAGGELIKFVVAYLKKKTNDIESTDKKEEK